MFSTGWMFLLPLNIILLITGMFMDGASAITILAPLIFATAIGFNIDPVHLGVVMVANLTIGNFNATVWFEYFRRLSDYAIVAERIGARF